MKKDFFKHKLEVGDHVIYIDRHYREFEVGVIVGFTPKFVRIAPIAWKEGTMLQESHRLVRLTGIDLNIWAKTVLAKHALLV